jgi:hypothetical protein
MPQDMKTVGLAADYVEHVQNCRKAMPMFQDLSSIQPRIYKNHPDFTNCGISGKIRSRFIPIPPIFAQFVMNRVKFGSRLTVVIWGKNRDSMTGA